MKSECSFGEVGKESSVLPKADGDGGARGFHGVPGEVREGREQRLCPWNVLASCAA